MRLIQRQPSARGAGELTLNAAPLDLAQVLRESLFERVPTVILTSATLATQGNFRFVRQRLGLTGPFADEHHVEEAIHHSPFDFGRQSILAVPTDLPLPAGDRDDRHDEATVRAVMAHAEISDGGLFVLFTSYRALRHVASELRRRRADRDWPLFVHGEGPRAQLVERFAASGRGSCGDNELREWSTYRAAAARLGITRLPSSTPGSP